MKQNKDRQRHYGTFRSPTPDENGYQAFMDFQEQQLKNNPKLRKLLRENQKQALSVALTQSQNGIDLIQDKELRAFHLEFNDRIWKNGLGSLPSSFNILEGFLKWNPNLFYFELFEEVEHLFSFFDFLDFVTSKDCSDSIGYFIENVEDDLIYSYNILNEVKDVTFKTKDSKEYVIGGISFVRRNNEVFMLIIAGELGDTNDITKKMPDYNPDARLKSYIEPAKERIKEAIKLFDKDDIWKVNIYIRINLHTKTIDSRYIQKDEGIAFSTITDDIGMFENAIKDKSKLEELVKQQLDDVQKYEAIFEVAYKCLFLPEYFDFYDDRIISEEHPTKLFNTQIKRAINKNEVNFHSKYFFKTKDVWVLDRDFIPTTGNFILKQSELKIEKDGYWQYLEPGKAGKDRSGNTIHNRTWIEKTISWYETTNNITKDIQINIPTIISQNSGYIYLLRNPSHDLNIFKIGLTKKTVEERANQLSGTSSPDKFVVISRWHVSDCVLAEKIIHEKLDKYRLNPNREFFKIEIEGVIPIILPIINKINNIKT